MNIRPVTPEDKVDLTNEQENASFYYENLPEPFISTTSSIMKAILYVYAENFSNPITFEQVAEKALKKLGKYQLNDFLVALEQHFIKFIFQGYIKIFIAKPNAIVTITDKPKTSELARFQSKHADFSIKNIASITNRLNDMIGIEVHEKYVLDMLDGKHSIDDIKKSMLEKFTTKFLTARKEKGEEISDSKSLLQ